LNSPAAALLIATVLTTTACDLTEHRGHFARCTKASGTGCSSINFVNHGSSIFGKNLDNSYTTEGLILINKRGVERISPLISPTGAQARWISRYASVNFSFVHVGFVWTGMNEKGLVISMMGIPEASSPTLDERPPLVDGFWIQYMLDNCATVDEVLTAAQNLRILTVDHYHIADRFGNSAALEFIGGEEIVYRGDSFPVSVLTNSTYGESLRHWIQYRERPFFTPNGSLRRFHIAAERLQDFTSRDEDSAIEYAFETLHEIRSERIYGYPHTTQWSIVFDAKNRKIFFRTYSHPGIKTFELRNFDFSCNEKVQMLDVQTPLSGDVFQFFQDLSFESACDHYRHFKESWQGFNPSQDEIESEISYYMNFQCVGLDSIFLRPSGRRQPRGRP
jgi:choloylglycine hydrolase